MPPFADYWLVLLMMSSYIKGKLGFAVREDVVGNIFGHW
jgi:hypothetical protein